MNLSDFGKSPIRMGMIGGGDGSFIGAVHRAAAALDGQIQLVCGALSSTPEKAAISARNVGISESRSYSTWESMLASEAQLPANVRMQFVSIVTPNSTHVPIASAALQAGFHVMCEKPLAVTLEEAVQLRKIVESTGKILGVAHAYTGYPMIKEAREIIRTGKLGRLRKVIVEYMQGWLSEENIVDGKGHWRSDPARAGISGCMGDIGTHAANLAEYVTGLQIEAVCAELTNFVPARALDDDGSVLMRMSDGVRGTISASQVAAGEENNLTIRAYGELGGVEWRQQEPNTLLLKWLHEPTQIIRTGGMVGSAAAASTRLPPGHPEGFFEAFANLYRGFAGAVAAHEAGMATKIDSTTFPDVDAGLRSMAFLQAVVESSRTDKWVSLEMGAAHGKN
ncbi:MAG: Gfo/Idh/MocA family oxidoreductase [Steroidobacteraceae bacterium]